MSDTKRGSRALIVDFGGVLTTSIFESFATFCAEVGVEPKRLREVLRAVADSNAGDSPIHLIETGRITEDDFNRHLAEALSEGLDSPIDPEGLKYRMFATTRPEPKMAEVVRKIKESGLPTAVLSNSWGGADYPRELFEVLFDQVVISGEVGLRKPDPEIYLMTAKLLQIDPEGCTFVDDLQVNVDGANAVGMRGVWHTEVSQTIAELSEIFGLDLSRVDTRD